MSVFAMIAALLPAPVQPPAPDDAELIARFRAGDTAAFPALYRTHVAAVYRRLTRILGPIPEREDLTQDVFFALHRALPRFRGEARIATMIQRIAINVAYDHLRRARRRPAAPLPAAFFDELIAPGSPPDVVAELRQQLATVFACLAKIKPKKRVAFLLRVIDGLSFEDIGKLVDATPDAVAKRVQHAQHELDALLARHGRTR